MKPEATQEADSVRIGESADYRYWAFISYSHADKGWGDWLYRALETYRVPKHLAGRVGAFGPVPRRLYPIFRDREELSASSSLGINIERALQQSRSLIVICSPRSSSSHWVNEEIKYFKSLNREDRILAFMVEGEPNASDGRTGVSPDQECFPEALRFRVGADGELTQERTEPIAGDARKTLADQDRSNGGWQNDLSRSYEKIGYTLKTQGNLGQALTQYEQSLSIRRALVDRDKSNIGWEHDLIALLVEVATTQSLSGGGDKVAEAKALLQEATNLAAEYSGSDQQALIDSINQSSRSVMVGQAPK